MSQENLIVEARSRLIWGESPEQVLQYLVDKGVSDQQAKGIIKMVQGERNAAIRGAGINKIITGILMGTAPAIAWFSTAWLGFIFTKILAVAILIAAVGLWRIVSGAMMLFAPHMEKGDLSKLSD